MDRDIEMSYIAGLFDGEGSVFISHPKASNGKKYKRLNIKIAQKDPMILEWVRDFLGYGRVHQKDEECSDYWATYRQAEKFITDIYPYMKIKGEKCLELLSECYGR